VFIIQRSIKCSVLHFSVSWYCNSFAARAYDQHIRMYILAYTYVHPFQRDLTCTDIFRIISTFGRVTYFQFHIFNLRPDMYYLYLILFHFYSIVQTFCTTCIWLYYLHSAVPSVFVATYVPTCYICLIVLLTYFVSTFETSSSKEAIRRKYPLILVNY